MEPIVVSAPSYQSLFLRLLWEGKEIISGTGFVMMHEDRPYLITNRHVLSGRSAAGDYISRHGVVPDEIAITHNRWQLLGAWIEVSQPLYDEQGLPLWLEHPDFGSSADVVALPMTKLGGVHLYPYEFPDPAVSPTLRPSDFVSIVGFPFGKASFGSLGIWIKGSLASEPGLDYDGMPRFLVDARSREGQSGSPVVIHSTGGPQTLNNGSMVWSGTESTHFLGIYSGRINDQSDIGIVWKPVVVSAILHAQKRPTTS